MPIKSHTKSCNFINITTCREQWRMKIWTFLNWWRLRMGQRPNKLLDLFYDLWNLFLPIDYALSIWRYVIVQSKSTCRRYECYKGYNLLLYTCSHRPKNYNIVEFWILTKDCVITDNSDCQTEQTNKQNMDQVITAH